MTTWMQTYSRVRFDPLNPHPSQINIEDIAHALSMICRFGGHARRFYSVAEHSVLVSRHCAPEDALAGLLHDAAEAYVGDLIRPIKHLPALAPYRDAEDWLLEIILEREGLAHVLPESVKFADNAVLAAERDHPEIVGGHAAPWAELPPPAPAEFMLMDPPWAKAAFMIRYRELTGGDR
jgi:uncharacterized protein